MAIEPQFFQYHLPSLYLDMARAMFCEIYGPKGSSKDDPHVQRRLVPTTFVTVAVSIVFAYQAVEAFFNGQLFDEWERRSAKDPRAARLREQFPTASSFDDIRWQELGEKVKTLCHIIGIQTPHEKNDKLWNRFKQLVEDARHFVIHPDPLSFQNRMEQIMAENQSGLYVEVAEEIIRHVFDESGTDLPEWVTHPTNFLGRGFTLLDVEAVSGDA